MRKLSIPFALTALTIGLSSHMATAASTCAEALRPEYKVIQTVTGETKVTTSETEYLVEESLMLMREVIMTTIALRGERDPLTAQISSNGRYNIKDVDAEFIDSLLSKMTMTTRALVSLKKHPNDDWNPLARKAVRYILLNQLHIEQNFIGSYPLVVALIIKTGKQKNLDQLREMIRYNLSKELLPSYAYDSIKAESQRTNTAGNPYYSFTMNKHLSIQDGKATNQVLFKADSTLKSLVSLENTLVALGFNNKQVANVRNSNLLGHVRAAAAKAEGNQYVFVAATNSTQVGIIVNRDLPGRIYIYLFSRDQKPLDSDVITKIADSYFGSEAFHLIDNR